MICHNSNCRVTTENSSHIALKLKNSPCIYWHDCQLIVDQ